MFLLHHINQMNLRMSCKICTENNALTKCKAVASEKPLCRCVSPNKIGAKKIVWKRSCPRHRLLFLFLSWNHWKLSTQTFLNQFIALFETGFALWRACCDYSFRMFYFVSCRGKVCCPLPALYTQTCFLCICTWIL